MKEVEGIPGPMANASGEGLERPYIPMAIHLEEADVLEFVRRDTPTYTRPVLPDVDGLFDIQTHEPMGWRIYGWSRKAQPPSPEAVSDKSRDAMKTLPPPPTGVEGLEEVIARLETKLASGDREAEVEHVARGIARDLGADPDEPINDMPYWRYLIADALTVLDESSVVVIQQADLSKLIAALREKETTRG